MSETADRSPSQEGKELTMFIVTALTQPSGVADYVRHLIGFHHKGGITLDNIEAVEAALETFEAHERLRAALRRR